MSIPLMVDDSALVVNYANCSRIEGEMREGLWYGKRTLYNHM